MRTVPAIGALRAALLTLGLIACNSATECIQPPCPIPLAITVTVTSSVTAASIPGSFVQTPGYTSLQCDQAPGTTCKILGGAATYELDIGAAGFQTVHRTVMVSGTERACGCPSITTQNLTIALVPVP